MSVHFAVVVFLVCTSNGLTTEDVISGSYWTVSSDVSTVLRLAATHAPELSDCRSSDTPSGNQSSGKTIAPSSHRTLYSIAIVKENTDLIILF